MEVEKDELVETVLERGGCGGYYMKHYFKSFGYSLLFSVVAGFAARFTIAPVVGFLHNRWIKIIPYDTVKEIYFWVGQIVGTLVFIVAMYVMLREKQWSKLKSLIAVTASVIILCVLGIIISTI